MVSIIAALIMASGFFSLFEQALNNVRKGRLQKEAGEDGEQGGRRRGKARRYAQVLKAAENPDRYRMAGNFWIIMCRTSAAILTGITVGRAALYATMSMAQCVAFVVAYIFAVLLVSSLFPRIIASRVPEGAAAATLPLFALFALPLRPVYALVQAAGKHLRPILPPRAEQAGMTEDELRHALLEGEKSGIVESKERTMVEGVFYLGDRPLGTFMTHRSDLQWLDVNDPPEDIRAKVLEYRSQRCFPVVDGSLDAIIGAAYLEDIILDLASNSPAGLRAIMKKALFAPETMPALKAFESFRRGKADFLLVMDEYGGFAGMVRVHDLMEEIVGELTASGGEAEQAIQQDDGTWLVDGALNIDNAAQLFSLPGLSAATGDYHTLAGFVLSLAGELPRTGDSFMYQGYRFTVVDMDGNRIDKVMVKPAHGAGQHR
jgi:putative hemolysin